MLRKFQVKFVMVNMVLITLVLAAVTGVQIWNGWRQVEQTCQNSLYTALLSEESQPNQWTMEGMGQNEGQAILYGWSVPMGGGAYLPTLCVDLDAEGGVLSATAQHVSVSDEVLQRAVNSVVMLNGDSGILYELGLRYQVLRGEDGGIVRVAFAERDWELGVRFRLLLTSATTFLAAFLVFLIISLLLSKWVLKPVKESWRRQREFMVDASQAMKAPLAVIQADVNILLSHPRDTVEGQRKWIDFIGQEAERAKMMVGDLLFLTR